jgi:hypothetical protein
MRKLQTLKTTLAGLILIILPACSGGGGDKPAPEPPKTASKLVYTDPTGTGYRLVKSASSTDTLLILELKGPASDTGRGVSFGLQVDSTKARFVKVSAADAEYAQNGVFQLGDSPQLFKTWAEGGTLRVSLAQKGKGGAKSLSEVLARVAVELQTGVTLTQGTVVISFSAANDAKALLGDSGPSTSITISAGSLTAQ